MLLTDLHDITFIERILVITNNATETQCSIILGRVIVFLNNIFESEIKGAFNWIASAWQIDANGVRNVCDEASPQALLLECHSQAVSSDSCG